MQVKWSLPLAPNGLASTERANFNHLVLDIAWFGLALAATSRFTSVYAIRLGASPSDLGWLTALPALVLLLSSSVGALWVRRFSSVSRALIFPGLGFRFIFLLPAFAPLFPRQWQPAWLIISAALPALMQGIAATAFVTLMRSAIHDQQMQKLLSRRSMVMNITIAVGALAFGLWLEQAPFPLNYQVMYVIAFVFALISLRHCLSVNEKFNSCHRYIPREQQKTSLREEWTRMVAPWKTPAFRSVALVVVITHIAFFSVFPVTPLHIVRNLGATEGFMALFGLVELSAGAMVGIFATRISAHIGTRAMIALAMLGTGVAAMIFAFSPNMYVTLIGAAISGATWTATAMIGLFAYFTENTPADKMTDYSVAYHQVIGAATFVGPLLGSALANSGMNLVTVLLIGAALRLLSAPLLEHHLMGKIKTVGAAATHKIGLRTH